MADKLLTIKENKMEYTKGENIEHRILEAIDEVLRFKDPNTVKAIIILRRLQAILGLKDLAAAPDLYDACKQALRTFEARGILPPDDRYMMINRAIAKAETESK